MTDPTTPEPQAPDAFRDLPLPDALVAYTQVAVFNDLVGDYAKAARATITSRLLAAHEQIGSKSFTVKGDDGAKVAQITLRESKGGYAVSDPEAFLTWVKEHFVTEVQVSFSVNPSFEKQLLKRLEVTDDGQIIDTATGVEVAGVTHSTGGLTGSFGTTYVDADTKERVAAELIMRATAGALPVFTELVTAPEQAREQ